MTAFTEAQRTQIRSVMGATKRYMRFLNFRYPIEQAMDEVGADDTTNALVTAALNNLTANDAQITELMDLVYVKNVDQINLDPGKGMALLIARGRMQIRIIADALGLQPIADYYSAAPTINDTDFI